MRNISNVDELATVFNKMEEVASKLTKGSKSKAGIKGSAVTGESYKTGKVFDENSDLDFFIVSDELYKKGIHLGAKYYNNALAYYETKRVFPELHKVMTELLMLRTRCLQL